MRKKFIAMLCVLSIFFAGCSAKEKEVQESAGSKVEEKKVDETGTHDVIDHAGNTVKVPNKISRIVIDQIPILSTYMAYFNGETPYIVGYAGSFKEAINNTVLKNISPKLLEASETVKAQGDLNVEEILKLKPDVIFYNANNKKHAEELKKTGIPIVGFATIGHETPADSLERYKQWLKLLEDVFNEKGKMDNMFAKGDEIVKDVKDRIAKIPENERPTAMVLFRYAKGVPHVAGKGTFGDFWLKNLGVKNVAEETKGFAQTTFEEIYNWNPEVLYLNGPGLLNLKTKDVLENKVEGADFSKIRAVVDKRVYNSTLGMWNWFTPNPDAPLVFAWLASKTYPEQFKDYPLKKIIKEYYKTFYKYEIKDSELEEMLSL